jgi:drug/metabolite transporter (DMT)-like permease
MIRPGQVYICFKFLSLAATTHASAANHDAIRPDDVACGAYQQVVDNFELEASVLLQSSLGRGVSEQMTRLPKAQASMSEKNSGHPVQGIPDVLSNNAPEKRGALKTVGPFFLILGVMWSIYFLRKDLFPEKSIAYIVLAGFSFGITSVSMHTLNKVCIDFTNAPSTVTVVQMAIALICFMAVYYREVLQADKQQMMKWCVVPLFYAAMLNTSLLGYEYLTLTLVTLLRNCAPVLTMCIEQFTMPPEHRPKFTLPVMAAFATMITGAFLFSYTQESFPFIGLVIIVVNTVFAILDRVVQRRLLVEECKDLPLQACMVINNSLGMIPTLALAAAQHEFNTVRGNMANWTDPGIILLLVMSGFMGLGIGLFALMCQKVMSATSFQVLQNATKVGVVAIGTQLFGDKVDTLARVVGLVLSLAGSAAYGYAKSLEMPVAKSSDKLAPLKGDEGQKA